MQIGPLIGLNQLIELVANSNCRRTVARRFGGRGGPAEEAVRYILRRNPRRAEEIQANRQSKQASLEALVAQKNTDLEKSAKAQAAVALKDVQARAAKLKIGDWVRIETQARELVLSVDQEALDEVKKLDGCYVIKTDLPAQRASAQTVHDRYKDLMLVEQNFRVRKTTELDLRPIHVRLESSTRGNAFVVMLD